MIYEGYQKRSAAYDRIFDNYTQALRGLEMSQPAERGRFYVACKVLKKFDIPFPAFS